MAHLFGHFNLLKELRFLVFHILIIVLLLSCDKDLPSIKGEDCEILELAYNDDYFYPLGFYQESQLEGSRYYENTVSTKPLEQREDIWIELSTNDINEALLWSENSNDYSSVNRKIISERETEKFFKFKRHNVDNNSDVLLSRIHKSSYFIPIHNKFQVPDTIGIYNGVLDEQAVKEFIEYLWGCGSLGLNHSKVIVSQIDKHPGYFEQYIQSIIIVYGDWGIKDYIYIFDNYLAINKTNRTIILKTNEIKTVQGK